VLRSQRSRNSVVFPEPEPKFGCRNLTKLPYRYHFKYNYKWWHALFSLPVLKGHVKISVHWKIQY
jgi:hypothetical protein